MIKNNCKNNGIAYNDEGHGRCAEYGKCSIQFLLKFWRLSLVRIISNRILCTNTIAVLLAGLRNAFNGVFRKKMVLAFNCGAFDNPVSGLLLFPDTTRQNHRNR